MHNESIRNIAIIAHVDHGKTTLVDGMLRQSNIFRKNQELTDRVMDSMDLERERGITISAKNAAVQYKDIKINIVDTPGHADFGGEVERSLNMVDGALLMVDSSEGPLPQTRFVLKKALEKGIRIILVINKIDRPDQRIDEVLDEVFELFLSLNADDKALDFPIVYTIARDGIAHKELKDGSETLEPLFETIINQVPPPNVDKHTDTAFLVTNLDYDSYVGQIAIGRLFSGSLSENKQYSHILEDKTVIKTQLSAIYKFQGMERVRATEIVAGEIAAIAGVDAVRIGDTITSVEDPIILDGIRVDEPTVSMVFYVNNSPFSGREGKFLTSRHIKTRLERETLRNVAVKVNPTERADAFEVCGRGELQLAVIIETMRREGYELLVSRPNVLVKEVDGVKCEPYDRVFIDVPDEFTGTVTEKLSVRKGKMMNFVTTGKGRSNLEFVIPVRGLLGYRNEFLTDTKGTGIMNTLFEDFMPWAGAIEPRNQGAIVADRPGRITGYASLAMEDRGFRVAEVGTEVYEGMIVGIYNRQGNLNYNITKEKKLTNMRSSTSEQTEVLKACLPMTLDAAIEFITDDELVEVTPKSIRLRKEELNCSKRVSIDRKTKEAGAN